MRLPFLRAFKHKGEDPEELRRRVIEISLTAQEALQRSYTLNRVDTSAFQEARIYKPLRESLGWTEQGGWRRNPPRIGELQARLPGTTDPKARKELLIEIVGLTDQSLA
jgi:hypothetical protein